MAYTENFLGEQTLVMGNEQYIRKMAIGSNWTYVRIALRCCVTCAPNVTIAAALGVGLTYNMRQQYASDADMVWWCYNNLDAPQNWWTSASGIAYSQGQCRAYAKLGTVTTLGIAGLDDYNNGRVWRCAFGCLPNRFLAYVDFYRSGGLINAKTWSLGNNSAVPTITDTDQGKFYYDLETYTPAVLNNSYQNLGDTSYTGAGVLDSLWIRWRSTNSAYKLMISDLAVCRMA